MNLWLAVAIGGAVGAMARYSVSVVMVSLHPKFPVATLFVNVAGSFLIGVLYVLIVEKALLAPVWRHVLMIGFLGAFTTFSTFSIETLHLYQTGHWQLALIYLMLSFILGVTAVFAGIVLMEKIIT